MVLENGSSTPEEIEEVYAKIDYENRNPGPVNSAKAEFEMNMEALKTIEKGKKRRKKKGLKIFMIKKPLNV